jgi:hypothetical protein
VAVAWVARAARAAVKRILCPLILFAIAFGYSEATQVVYMRAVAAPIRARLGLPPDALFPLPQLDQVGPLRSLVPKEQVREAATILMLAGVAWAVARDFRTWLAALSLIFGIWDLAYYGWLRVLLGWPSSVLDWDVLFLLPIPWAAPVLAPLISASSLVWGGVIALLHPPVKISKATWILFAASSGLMLVSFTWEWRYWIAGGMPRNFPWSIFAAAEILGVIGFLLTRRRPNPRST